eukprot:CAMPEP_0202469102 /NCGR_PEP_ID=MMETSP1360-20130828/77473_1 /ASSEMBLY_ACC=CAM_ASM_000848 /TAXON_ID=515479 /ORGANISM="Licmophora paradoxa, Strain CCMP2313" /LENGTH=46 /DNA_ID= /DNA_START= /DNA_END= /DNA_ORIENTATION=
MSDVVLVRVLDEELVLMLGLVLGLGTGLASDFVMDHQSEVQMLDYG